MRALLLPGAVDDEDDGEDDEDIGAADIHQELHRAKPFLPLPRTGTTRKPGRPPVGFFGEMVRTGDLDAAGYGTFLVADVRRHRGARAWTRRTVEAAWRHGCRNPRLADLLASLLASGNGQRRRDDGSADDHLANLRSALVVVSGSLDANAGERDRSLAPLRRRIDGLDQRIAQSLDQRIAVNERTQQRRAECEERRQQRSATGEPEVDRTTCNPRPPRRVALGRPPPS